MARKILVVALLLLSACATSGVRSKGTPAPIDPPEEPAVAAAHAGG